MKEFKDLENFESIEIKRSKRTGTYVVLVDGEVVLDGLSWEELMYLNVNNILFASNDGEV